MKILFATPTCRVCDFGVSCAEGLRKLGNQVELWDYRQTTVEVGSDEANRLLAKQFRKQRFDLFFVVKGESIEPKVIKFARKKGVRTAIHMVDDPHREDLMKTLPPYFDKVFTPMVQGHGIYEEMGVRAIWLPLTCSDSYQPIPNCEENIDVSFIGTRYEGRSEPLKALRGKFPNWKIQHFGSDWSDTKRVPDEEAINVINETKLNLVISQRENMKYGVVNPRTFEIMACRKFALVDSHIGLSVIRFRDREHLAVYFDESDLLRAVEHWFWDPKGRAEIAERGYEEFIAHHNALKRMETMLKLMQL